MCYWSSAQHQCAKYGENWDGQSFNHGRLTFSMNSVSVCSLSLVAKKLEEDLLFCGLLAPCAERWWMVAWYRCATKEKKESLFFESYCVYSREDLSHGNHFGIVQYRHRSCLFIISSLQCIRHIPNITATCAGGIFAATALSHQRRREIVTCPTRIEGYH
jgi:hypothetical protein